LGYIGRTPTGSILTGADIADGSISTAKIADTAVSTAKIADDAVTLAKTTGVNPTTEAVVFRLSSDLSGNADPVTNWEIADDAMAGKVGTGITESSGIFSFGSTGIYAIQFTGSAFDASTDDVQINLEIKGSSNGGGAYDSLGQGMTNLHHAAQHTFSISCMADITSTSSSKIKFVVDGNNGSINGNSGTNFTFVTFVRMGDT
jgi:hypothetical protein